MAEIQEFVDTVKDIVSANEGWSLRVELPDTEVQFRHTNDVISASFTIEGGLPYARVTLSAASVGATVLQRGVRFSSNEYDQGRILRWPSPEQTNSILSDTVSIEHAVALVTRPLSSRTSRLILGQFTEDDLAAQSTWLTNLSRIRDAEVARERSQEEAYRYALRRYGPNPAHRRFTSKAR